jgi:hypothetical protein
MSTNRDSTTTTTSSSSKGQAPSESELTPLQSAPWCKVFCRKETNELHQEYYFINTATHETTWEEPNEGYLLWDYGTNDYHTSGLQQPTSKEKCETALSPSTSNSADKQKWRQRSSFAKTSAVPCHTMRKTPPTGGKASTPKFMAHTTRTLRTSLTTAQAQTTATYQNYDSYAQFNAHTGRYQTGEQSADRHDPANRANRQMSAFFDVDSAANSHDGRSLKEERRNKKLTGKEIAEMNRKRKEKKDAKRMAFLRS